MKSNFIKSLMLKYPHISVNAVIQPLNETDFEAQKAKQNQREIEGGAIGLVMLSDSEIVLSKRTKVHKGWALLGGRVEKGEEFDTAFIREVKEEAGITVGEPKLLMIEKKRFVSPQNETLDFWLAVFIGYALNGECIRTTQEAIEEGLEIASFSVNDLPKNMILKDKEKVLAALEDNIK